jgi:2-dehydro-3-deoxyphosphogluconate aldolase/(4S)-4-hydroxy-2-oxoglutarate aldolase
MTEATSAADGAEETLQRLASFGIVPVVEVPDVAVAGPLLEALSAGGLPAAEITLRTVAGLEAIRRLARGYPEALIGAGTVRNTEDASRAIDAGARFVVSAAFDPEVVALCGRNGTLAVPGVCTPTEIEAALRAGAKLLKFFPAEPLGGTSFLKAVGGPYRGTRFMPSGGINIANLADYLALPHVVACGGSWMVAPALLAAGDFDRIRTLTEEALALVSLVRGQNGATA